MKRRVILKWLQFFFVNQISTAPIFQWNEDKINSIFGFLVQRIIVWQSVKNLYDSLKSKRLTAPAQVNLIAFNGPFKNGSAYSFKIVWRLKIKKRKNLTHQLSPDAKNSIILHYRIKIWLFWPMGTVCDISKLNDGKRS